MSLCTEDYYEDNGVEVEFEVKGTEEHEGSSRHSESWSKVVKRKSDGKFFRVFWSNSVKDEMGWRECNEFQDFGISEVFPTMVSKVIYK